MDKENENNEDTTPQVPEDQQKDMADILDTVAEPEGEPAEKPAAKQPDDKGQAADDKPAEDPKGEGDTGKDTPKEGEAEPAPKEKAAGEDPEFEVAGKDGVRSVKLSALKTTYLQHHALQTRHEAIKPCLDLFREANIPPNRMFEFLVAGIQSVFNASTKQQAPAAAPGTTQASPAGYQGPFESAEQEAEIKQLDPHLYRTTKALWDQNKALSDQLVALTGKLEQQAARPPASPNGAAAPSGDPAEPSPERKRVDGLLGGFQKSHASYFKAHPDRLDAFKSYLGTKFSSVPLSHVDDAFLAVAFQTFDPAYYAAFQEELARARVEKQAGNRRRTFGESDSVRGSVASFMTEQQEAMADILGM